MKDEMQYKPNQRVAYYRVTGKSEPCAAKVEIGTILVDRPRGEITSWDFRNTRTGKTSWVAGECIGFARVDPETMQPVPEPDLRAELDRMREAADLRGEDREAAVDSCGVCGERSNDLTRGSDGTTACADCMAEADRESEIGEQK